MFRFPAPIGRVSVVLAAQDEVVTAPHIIAMRQMDAKIGGSDIDRLRRWYRQGKLRRSRGIVAARFPRTPTPGTVDRLIHRGLLRNARFAAAVVVTGVKAGRSMTVRWDVTMPTLHTLYRRGHRRSPIAWATAQMMARTKKTTRDGDWATSGKNETAFKTALTAERHAVRI